MEEQLEQLELRVESTLFEASLEQLHELVKGTAMRIDGMEAMRKTRLIKEVRKVIEAEMGEEAAEQVEYYSKISESLHAVPLGA